MNIPELFIRRPIMTSLVIVFSFIAVLALFLILGNLVLKGASSIDWAFFTKSPVPAGQTGGVTASQLIARVRPTRGESNTWEPPRAWSRRPAGPPR